MQQQIIHSGHLGLLVRNARKDQGLTQEELAGMANIGRRFISELERGKSTAQIGKILLVLNTLGIPLFTSNYWMTDGE